MNKKVLKSMIALVLIFLTGLYVLKIFFPEQFVLTIQNEKLITIGNYIDNNEWLYTICTFITSFITYWLYCCACCGRKYLKWYECLYILGIIAIVRVLNIFDLTIANVISVLSFVVLPALMKGNLKNVAIVYSIHGISQGLSLSIRNLVIYLKSIDTLTILALGFESYLWLILMYLLFNYKESNKHEN